MKKILILWIAVWVLLTCMVTVSSAFTLDAVPYAQGTIWSDSDTRPNYNFGVKVEARNLCTSVWCKFVELYVGYDVGRYTAENGYAVPCTEVGCTTDENGYIPDMRKVVHESHWDQTFFGGMQFRFNLLGK